jgi:hypothetical protein
MSCAFRSAVISASIFCFVVVKLFLAKPASVRHLVDITHLLPSVFSARRIVEVVVIAFVPRTLAYLPSGHYPLPFRYFAFGGGRNLHLLFVKAET